MGMKRRVPPQNPIVPPDGSQLILCTKSQYVLVDDDLYPILSAVPWHIGTYGHAVYKHYNGDGTTTLWWMHRKVLELNGVDIPHSVDHINGNPLDNRLVNLRPATHRQNMCNKKTRTNNKSGYRGVHWNPIGQNWRVQIKAHGKQKHIGVFQTKEEAAVAYDNAATLYYGEFARTNFPLKGES